MRVLHLNDIANVGYTLVGELRRIGVDAELLLFNTRKKKTLRVNQDTTSYTLSLKPSISSIPLFIKKLREKWSLVHVHYLYKYAYLLAALPQKYLLHIHGSDIKLAASPRNILDALNIKPKKYTIKRAKAVIVSTPNLTKYVESIGVDKEVEYVPNPVDTEFFSPTSSTRYRELFEELHSGVDLLITSPLSVNFSAKGQDLLLKVIATMDKNKLVNSYRLLLSRRGPDFHKLLPLIDKLNLRSKIRFIEPIPNSKIPGLYAVSDIVVPALSRSHVFGVTALEAMACRKPVVNTWHKKYYGETGFPQILYSEKSLGKILGLISSDTRYRRELAQQQMQWVTRNYSSSIIATRLLKIYKDILGY